MFELHLLQRCVFRNAEAAMFIVISPNEWLSGIHSLPEIVLFVTEFVINPNGKSEVCILHEYMQRVLKVRPVYNFFECGKFKPILVLKSLTSFWSWLEVGVSTLGLLGWIGMQGKEREKCGAGGVLFSCQWSLSLEGRLLSFSLWVCPSFFPSLPFLVFSGLPWWLLTVVKNSL